MPTTENKAAWSMNGFFGLIFTVGFGATAFFVLSDLKNLLDLLVGGLAAFISFTFASGLTTLSPNEARVITFLGTYLGTIQKAGFHWILPFTLKQKLSLRVQNFNSGIIKVNDAHGNPIEIAAIISWRVVNAARASFDVQNVSAFVSLQAEAALRAMASRFPYDSHDDPASPAMSLRSHPEEIADVLKRDVEDRLHIAGVDVLEARVSHLAYAQEIAAIMLRRQQAEAILSARRKIVDGAVGMVELALGKLEKDSGLVLDPARRATLVNNLLVAIISEREAQPVINMNG